MASRPSLIRRLRAWLNGPLPYWQRLMMREARGLAGREGGDWVVAVEVLSPWSQSPRVWLMGHRGVTVVGTSNSSATPNGPHIPTQWEPLSPADNDEMRGWLESLGPESFPTEPDFAVRDADWCLLAMVRPQQGEAFFLVPPIESAFVQRVLELGGTVTRRPEADR